MSLTDDNGRSGLQKGCNGGGNAKQGDHCIPTEDGYANGKSGVDDGSDLYESIGAEN